jgi:hypothetical protein
LLATNGTLAARRLLHLPVAELHDLFDEMLELPARHLSLQVPPPRLSSPELEALRWAVDHDHPEAVHGPLDAVLARIDTPQLRARLVRQLLDLAATGVIDSHLADTAILNLDTGPSALLRASLIHAVAVSVGASRTPSGLLVVSR